MGLGDLVQKAMYLGVGLASYAGEKAGEKFGELRVQVQKLADEMVERGEMTTDEARRFVDDMLNKAQQPPGSVPSNSTQPPTMPRSIEIQEDEATTPAAVDDQVDAMRRQVMELQDELRRLQRNE